MRLRLSSRLNPRINKTGSALTQTSANQAAAMALGCTSAITKRASDLVQTAPQPRWWEKSGLADAAKKLPEVIALSAKLDEIQEGLSDIQGQQSITISSKVHEETPAGADGNLDELFGKVRAAWDETKTIVAAIGDKFDVDVSFSGNKGISETVEALKAKNVAFDKVGEQLKDLGRQWQWMYRTSTPREDWLTESAVDTFLTANKRARAELTQAAMMPNATP